MGLRSTYNPIIGIPKYANDFTYGGGSYEADYPVANAKTKVYAQPARTTDLDAASLVMTGTSSTFKAVRTFGIAAHNMTQKARFRLRLYSDVAMSDQLYDSGWQKVWPSPYTYAGRNWYTPFFWTGGYTPEEIEGQIPFRPILLSRVYNIKAWRFDFEDDDNPDGYVEIGMLEVAGGWQPTVGIKYGSQYGVRDYTETTELEGGLRRHFEQQPSYVFDGEIPALPENEVFNQAFELFRRLGVSEPFIWIQFPTRPTTWLKKAKMVTRIPGGLFGHVTVGHDSVPLTLEEHKG